MELFFLLQPSSGNANTVIEDRQMDVVSFPGFPLSFLQSKVSMNVSLPGEMCYLTGLPRFADSIKIENVAFSAECDL